MDRQPIIVVGSLNMDFVIHVENLPLPGQTVVGSGFLMLPGGKGANQATAAARMGGCVRMVGCVGKDLFGESLKAGLSAAGVDVSRVDISPSAATGAAMIVVQSGGQNQIVVSAGANAELAPDHLDAAFRDLEGGILLLQLETPMETVQYAVSLAKKHGIKTILDPAPARPLDPSVLQQIDLLTPNESEALVLLGQKGSRLSLADAEDIATQLLGCGPAAVILKLGENGAWLKDGAHQSHLPARKVRAVDVTAAGDTFNGALAVALAEGSSISQAARFANAAASISVTRHGAQASIPSRNEVEAIFQ